MDLLQLLASVERRPLLDITGPGDLAPIDLTAANDEASAIDPRDTAALVRYFECKLAESGRRFLYGGYGEKRAWYARSANFISGSEIRSIHLGVDLWGPEGTPVSSPLDGRVHSYADNNAFGDYGPTIILMHDLGGVTLHSLFGHLSRASLQDLAPGQPIHAGQPLGRFGSPDVNGHWPPHLHFQLILNIGSFRGDYPGVAAESSASRMLANCPNPAFLLELPY